MPTTATYTTLPGTLGGPLSQRRSGQSRFFLPDHQGNTRLLTDTAATTTDARLTDAWGVQIASTGTTVNPFTAFGKWGYYQDSSIKFYVRRRHLRAPVGLWTNRDPFGSVDDLNLYRYVRNRPTSRFDPSGLFQLDESCANLPHEACGCMEQRQAILKGIINDVCSSVNKLKYPADWDVIVQCAIDGMVKSHPRCPYPMPFGPAALSSCYRAFCNDNSPPIPIVKCASGKTDNTCKDACAFTDASSFPVTITICVDKSLPCKGGKDTFDRNCDRPRDDRGACKNVDLGKSPPGLGLFVHEMAHGCAKVHQRPGDPKDCEQFWADWIS